MARGAEGHTKGALTQALVVDNFHCFSLLATAATVLLTSWVCCDTGVQAPKENRSSLGLPKRVLDLKAQFSARKQGEKTSKDQNNIIMGGRDATI